VATVIYTCAFGEDIGAQLPLSGYTSLSELKSAYDEQQKGENGEGIADQTPNKSPEMIFDCERMMLAVILVFIDDCGPLGR
jgi:hypothetical protein